jgi:hypothetical protein
MILRAAATQGNNADRFHGKTVVCPVLLLGNKMSRKEIDWKDGLEQLFSASVNQQTLEEAAELMVSVSSSDHDYHDECLTLFEEGIKAARAGDNVVIALINKSGYQVSSTVDAVKLLEDFQRIYLEEFRKLLS